MIFICFFSIAIAICCILNIIFGVLALKKHNKTGKKLFITSMLCTFVSISYLLSISFNNVTATSITSSIYFIGVDLMIYHMILFVREFIERKTKKISISLSIIITVLITYEIVMFTINIFTGIVIGYTPNPDATTFGFFEYQMHWPYVLHLVFTYLMVAAMLGMLTYNAVKVPREYKLKYLIIILGIITAVIINAFFLFIKTKEMWSRLDYSIFTYFIVIIFCYYSAFSYSEKGMLNHFKTYIFENIDQGIMLFDYNDQLILFNSRATNLLSTFEINKNLHINDFLNRCNIALINSNDDAYSIQCYLDDEGKTIPLRCDYRLLKNKHDVILGKLFVFADAKLETDILTGFHNWEAFKHFAKESSKSFDDGTSVLVCDINKMGTYNVAYGRNAGDKLIKDLADKLKEAFPDNAYFVRGHECYLMVISYDKTPDDLAKAYEKLAINFTASTQYGVSKKRPEDSSIVITIHRAISSMNAKKLLDVESTHSTIIASLVKALQQTDSDTEKHVERTEKLGYALGKRLNLTDSELANLSLLCLLHDIGKIAVPLDILNKPGKLTDDEWKTIKTHVEKGYQIALSSPELKGIAEMIKYHHERWDGKGYPDGLSRESIPLLSRIISVVDAFDAMTNDRSYRKAKSFEEAKEELRRCAGTQFDPKIASEFLQLIEDDSFAFLKDTNANVVIPTIKVSEITNSTTTNNVHKIPYSKYILDSNGIIVQIDEEFTNITGYTIDFIKENSIGQRDIIPESDRTDYLCLVHEQLAKTPMAYFEHRIQCKDKSIKYVFCIGRVYYDSAAREERTEIVIVNSSNTYAYKLMASSMEDKAETRLREWENLYRKDSLTGLLSHAAYTNDVEALLLSGKDVMLFMMDVDKFKEYNDTYGHKAGDEYLIMIAQAIQEFPYQGAYSCRMGGDEFSLAFPYVDKEKCKKIATEFFDALNIKISATKGGTKVSMGVSITDGNSKTFNQLYEEADKALYKSKERGRCRITFHNL